MVELNIHCVNVNITFSLITNKGDTIAKFRHPITTNLYSVFEHCHVVLSNSSIITILYNPNVNLNSLLKLCITVNTY